MYTIYKKSLIDILNVTVPILINYLFILCPCNNLEVGMFSSPTLRAHLLSSIAFFPHTRVTPVVSIAHLPSGGVCYVYTFDQFGYVQHICNMH